MLKSRKKILLSSIAMLLVALVALGTATFAWFTQNKTVTATGFAGKASSALGLKILSESDAYANSTTKDIADAATYGQSTTLNTNGTVRSFAPVSMVPAAAPAAFKTNGTSEADGARKTATEAVTGAVAPSGNTPWNSGDYYMEKVYVVLSGASNSTDTGTFDIDKLTATFGTGTMADGVRFFVYYHNASGSDVLVGQYAKTDNTTTDEITATAAAGTASTTSSVTYSAVPGTNKTSSDDYTVGTTAGTNGCWFTIVAFLDGQDSTVKTENINTLNLIENIDLQLTLK